MAPRRRGARASALNDDAAPSAEPLFPDEPTEDAPDAAAMTGELPGWAPPPAQPYLAPALAPDPMRSPAAMDDPDLPWWLALNRVKGIGPARFSLLLDALGSA
ncbi:MAG: hypothetical protein ACHQ1E_10230, partial [Ktedonobacterales bacterium]